MSTSVYAKPTPCRLKQAYAAAYATYAVCMEAYARGTTCLVEFTLYALFCIQKKRYSVVVVVVVVVEWSGM